MKYVALLGQSALQRARAAVKDNDSIVVVDSFVELLRRLSDVSDECILVDPSLLTTANAEALSNHLGENPRAIVAYSSLSKEAVESCVVLARETASRFVFRGASNERSALARALLIAPNTQLGNALVSRLSDHIAVLPRDIRESIVRVLKTGMAPANSASLASQSDVARRSLDRWLSRAGFQSGRLVISASRLVAGYDAITVSKVPLRRVAAMLGYTTQRTLDSHIQSLLEVSSSTLRCYPIPVELAAEIASRHLVSSDIPVSNRYQRGARKTVTKISILQHQGKAASVPISDNCAVLRASSRNH
jgi:hypothetical protein